RDNAERLIKYGVKIYYMKDSFVHSKLITSESCAVVGTVNFDMRSFYQQFENAVISDDKKLIGDLKEDFERTFNDCDHPEKPQKNGLFKTLAIAVLRFVSPLM
ncbi:MAG: phospholipase D-like domain-containing protein, partial [Candidatus Coproplasma sp.]